MAVKGHMREVILQKNLSCRAKITGKTNGTINTSVTGAIINLRTKTQPALLLQQLQGKKLIKQIKNSGIDIRYKN